MLFFVLQAVLATVLLTLIFNVPGASAEFPISQLPLYLIAGQCGQSCARSVSSVYSTILGCPLSDPANCLCSLAPEALMAGEASACCLMSCTASSHTATDYALPYVGQGLISSYCQVNGYVTPTAPADPATLVAISELSKLPITKVQPSTSLAPATMVVPATSTIFTIPSSQQIASTSFVNTNALYTGTSQSSLPSSTGTASINVSSSTSGGLGWVAVFMIAIFAIVGLVLIMFIVLFRRRLRLLFHHICLWFKGQQERDTAQPEVSQPAGVYAQTRDTVDCDHGNSRVGIQVNEERASAGGWTPSIVSEDPDREIWTQRIQLFSGRRNTWVSAVAKIDTGTKHNWMHSSIVDEGQFPVEPVTPGTFNGFAENVTCDKTTKVEWYSEKTHKPCTTIFNIPSNVSPEAANFQVLLGLDFLTEKKLIRVNSDPHLFNIRSSVADAISSERNEEQC